jgi:predicted O-linked N-acetylglucosamine transferase (SPINDLY family)
VFAPRMPYLEHLARYEVAGLALDTLPYTSHTTLSDALWSACPVVGLSGDTFAARVAGSLLTAAMLPDLITTNLDDYEALAFEIATDAARLQALRARIALAKESAPQFDSTRFTRDLEALYRSMV